MIPSAWRLPQALEGLPPTPACAGLKTPSIPPARRSTVPRRCCAEHRQQLRTTSPSSSFRSGTALRRGARSTPAARRCRTECQVRRPAGVLHVCRCGPDLPVDDEAEIGVRRKARLEPLDCTPGRTGTAIVARPDEACRLPLDGEFDGPRGLASPWSCRMPRVVGIFCFYRRPAVVVATLSHAGRPPAARGTRSTRGSAMPAARRSWRRIVSRAGGVDLSSSATWLIYCDGERAPIRRRSAAPSGNSPDGQGRLRVCGATRVSSATWNHARLRRACAA